MNLKSLGKKLIWREVTNYSYNKIELESKFPKEFNEFRNKMELGLGCLRAVSQIYKYSCNKVELGINFQINLKSLGINWSWGSDGCAKWRKVTITITIRIDE